MDVRAFHGSHPRGAATIRARVFSAAIAIRLSKRWICATRDRHLNDGYDGGVELQLRQVKLR